MVRRSARFSRTTCGLPRLAADPDGWVGPLTDVIHVEADIHATEGNPNGFAVHEFVPYLKISYKLIPAKGGEPVDQGEMIPMIAADGLHYGASMQMPPAGAYRLIYAIKPPSAGGLGRHSDPVTGVAPWWEPFEATFEWDDCPGPKGATPEKKSTALFSERIREFG